GLLNIHVLSAFHGEYGSGRMDVIRRGDGDRVDVLLLVQHHPVVVIQFRLGKILYGRLCRTREVDVAKCDYFFTPIHRRIFYVASTLPARTDRCEHQLIARGGKPHASEHMAGHDKYGRGDEGVFDESAARGAIAWIFWGHDVEVSDLIRFALGI